jgi:hypothetical protein
VDTLSEPSSCTMQQDQQSEESDVKPTEANQIADDIELEEGSDPNTALISSTERTTDESSIDKVEEETTPEENIVDKSPKEKNEEAQKSEESTEKQLDDDLKQISEIYNPSEVTEVELGRSDTLAPEKVILVLASAETFDDEFKNTDIDAKSAELENVADEPLAQKDISTETSNAREVQIELSEQEQVLIQPSNARELQINQAEIIAEQDQPTQESAVKPAELDLATNEVSTVHISEVNATVSAGVKEIEEVSIAKEEGVVLQEEEVAGEMPKEEVEKIAAAHEKHTEEEVNHYLLSLRNKETLLLGSTWIN